MSNNDLWCSNCESNHHPADYCAAEADGYDDGRVVIRCGDSPDILMEEAKWGEEVVVGMFCGEKQTIRRPLNTPAINIMDPSHRIVLMLHDRIMELEERLEQVEAAA